MQDTNRSPNLPIYEILIQGHVDPHWTDWFEGLSFTYLPDGNTQLSGVIVDQAALHGILNTIRDLGMELVSVRQKGRRTPK